jgi:hypothetical protein
MVNPDLYKSSREKGVFIQRREKRISSRGEVQEISYAGLRSQHIHKGFKL